MTVTKSNIIGTLLDQYWQARTAEATVTDELQPMVARYQQLPAPSNQQAKQDMSRLDKRLRKAQLNTKKAAKNLTDQVALLRQCHMLSSVLNELPDHEVRLALRTLLELAWEAPPSHRTTGALELATASVAADLEATSFLAVAGAAHKFVQSCNPDEFLRLLKTRAWSHRGVSAQVCYAYMIAIDLLFDDSVDPYVTMQKALEQVLDAARKNRDMTRATLRQQISSTRNAGLLQPLLNTLPEPEKEHLNKVLNGSLAQEEGFEHIDFSNAVEQLLADVFPGSATI